MHPTSFCASCVLAILLTACGGEEDAGTEPEGPDPGLASVQVPTPEESMTMSLDDLEARYRALAAQAAEDEGTVDGVAESRSAAELARVLALRDPEHEEAHLDHAREHLREASRRKALEGACTAALELARLDARDRDEPTEAFVVAYRTARRFDADSHADCVAEARRITATLDHHRPSPARLAAIDADPDADDPSVDSGRASRSEPGLARGAGRSLGRGAWRGHGDAQQHRGLRRRGGRRGGLRRGACGAALRRSRGLPAR